MSANEQQHSFQTPEGSRLTRILERLSRIPCAGIGLALISGVVFATATFFVKLTPNVNPMEIVISRGIIQIIIYMPIILWNRMPLLGAESETTILIMRGFCGSFDLITGYMAIRLMPLADASTIIFAAPVFVYIIAWLILREECGLFQVLTVMVTFGGVVLISKPSFLFGEPEGEDPMSGTRTAGTILAFVSSIASALSFVLIRMLKKSPPPVVINSYSVSSIISSVIAIAVIRNFFYTSAQDLSQGVGVPGTMQEIGFMIGNGMCGVVGQLCLTLALKIEDASLVSLARTMDIVMAFVYQIIWLPNEAVHWTSFVGALIVCSCVCVSGLRRWLKDKAGSHETLWRIINCGLRQRQNDKA